MSASPAPFRITFLDDDHVAKLLRVLLTQSGHEEADYISRFFHPEQVDVQALRSLALPASPTRVEARLAKDPGEVAGSSAIVFRRGNVTAEMMDACPTLKLIQRIGKQSDTIDVDAALKRGVFVSTMPRRTLSYTAEHSLMMMLMLAKQLHTAERAMQSGTHAAGADGSIKYNWPGLAGVGGLEGETLGIIGLGEIGILLAERARSFGMRVVYNNRSRLKEDRERGLGVGYLPLDELLSSSRFVSLHAPNIPENRGLMAQAQFAKMRRGAFFINTSRGALVDEDALYAALDSGHLGGAGLDVHVTEPRQAGDRFGKLENVVLTPHVGGGSLSGIVSEMSAMSENIANAIAGIAPRFGRVA